MGRDIQIEVSKEVEKLLNEKPELKKFIVNENFPKERVIKLGCRLENEEFSLKELRDFSKIFLINRTSSRENYHRQDRPEKSKG